jgi:ribosomal protein L40E
MLPNLINVNSQMQQLADKAVIATREKFGFSLDFTENSLQQLEVLLQQAHEHFKQASSSGNPLSIPIQNTVRMWGSFFGEIIRRKAGGDWVVDQKNVFLQIGNRRLDPLGQVQLRIVNGPQYNLQEFYQGLLLGFQNNQVDLSAKSELGEKEVQKIHCQKCKHENAPNAQKCSRCGTNLLPGAGLGERFGVLGCSIILAVTSFALAFLVFIKTDVKLLLGLILFGVLMLGFGFFWSVRKTPRYERYETRAKRHVSLDLRQAIADYGSAIDLAPEAKAFDLLRERAKLYQKLGMTIEARADWQLALDNINKRIAKSKTPVIDQKKQRAEIYKNLGMEDEYAMEMLQYTIEKEKTFKFKSGDIAMGMEEGVKKGTEDAKRKELQQLRAEIMNNHKYGIVGQCKQCRSIVEINHLLECANNPKHHKITNISPIIRKTGIS